MHKAFLLALCLALPAAAQNYSGPAPEPTPLTADSMQHPGVPAGTLSPKRLRRARGPQLSGTAPSICE